MLSAACCVLNLEQARQTARHFDNRNARLGAAAFALEFSDEMQALVGNRWKRMRGIEPNRRQHRRNFAREGSLHPPPLRGRQVRTTHQMNARLA